MLFVEFLLVDLVLDLEGFGTVFLFLVEASQLDDESLVYDVALLESEDMVQELLLGVVVEGGRGRCVGFGVGVGVGLG